MEAVPVFPACQVWAASLLTNNVAIIDTHTSQVSNLDVGSKSSHVTMLPDASKVYVTTKTQGVRVVDVGANYALSSIASNDDVVVASPTSNFIYIIDPQIFDPQRTRVEEFDVATGLSTNRGATVSMAADELTVSPDGNFVFVSDTFATPSSVTKISLADFSTSTATVSATRDYPQDVVVSPDNTTLYVAMNQSGEILQIDTATMTVQRTLVMPGTPIGLVLTSDGSTLWATWSLVNTDEVVKIDTSTLQVVQTIVMGDFSSELAIAPDDSQLFVASPGNDTVSRIDTASNTIIETIPVNRYPSSIAIGPANCTVVPQQAAAPAPAPVPSIPIWRVSMDPAGGVCDDADVARDAEWTSVFVGYRYLPGPGECEREGYSFVGWADVDDPGEVLTLPLLTDPSDGVKRWFVAANHSVVAVWEKVEEVLDDLTGTAPGAFVGGPDRATVEGGGVVDGYYIPPGTVFGPWMLTSPR